MKRSFVEGNWKKKMKSVERMWNRTGRNMNAKKEEIITKKLKKKKRNDKFREDIDRKENEEENHFPKINDRKQSDWNK